MKKDKKHIVINGELLLAELFLVPLFIMFLTAALSTHTDKVSADAEAVVFLWVVAFLCLAGAILCYVLMRHYHEFDSKGIKVCYFAGKYQYIKWSSVKAVMVWSNPTNTRGGMLIDLVAMVFFVYYKFAVVGDYESTLKRDEGFIVSKSFRTAKYINQYWNGEIEGLLSKKSTKKRETKKLDCVKVQEIEQSVRKKADLVIDRYRDAFNGISIEVRRKYVYSYKDESGDTAVRPAVDYLYNVEVSIHKKNRSHKNNIVFYTVLADGRPGKTEYIGYEDDEALAELEEKLEYYYKEINSVGFESCREQKLTAEISIKKEIVYRTVFAISITAAIIITIVAFVLFLA